MSKLKLWQQHSSWEEAEAVWDKKAAEATKEFPIKHLKQYPQMVGITQDTAKNLKWKSLWWMATRDHKLEILRGFIKHPLKYAWNYIKSLKKTSSFNREGDFFLYGLNNIEEFKQELNQDKSLFVVGFSYCHKPFECPSGRFTDQCVHQLENPVCRQCFIGKTIHALPEERTIPLIIPTVHYIGGKIFEIVHKNPNKKVLFLITACELTLKMFGDWGNMVSLKGIGVRLDGRICNTMKAFELSEKGIKPGLTVVRDETQKQILDLIKEARKARK